MSDTDSSSLPAAADESDDGGAPFPLRVAAVLAGVVGVLTALTALAGPGAAALGVGVGAGVVVCAGAVLVWRQRRLGGWLVLAAFVLPTVIILALTGRFRPPSLLLTLAAITVLANWRLLR